MPTISDELKLAQLAFEGRDFVNALSRYKKLASLGSVESLVMVGWLQMHGLGCAKDELAAAESFQRAATLGSVVGQFYHARYLTKIGRDAEAIGFYRLAAEKGNLPAIFWLGMSFARGLGVKNDIAQAYLYFGLAARRGHVHAWRELAALDFRGARGSMWQMISVFEFLIAIAMGVVIGIFNAKSDRLRG